MKLWDLDTSIKENKLENNLYKRRTLYNLITKARLQFHPDIKIHVARFFYYFIHNDYKYIHKESYLFNITLYDTFDDNDIIKDYCNLKDKSNILKYKTYQKNILNYIRGNYGFLPEVQEDEFFFKAKILKGTILYQLITRKDFLDLYEHYKISISLGVNPFSSLLSKNIIRTGTGIKLIDFKQLRTNEFELALPFLVFLGNKDESSFNLFTFKENKDYDFSEFINLHNVDISKVKYIFYKRKEIA